MNFTMLGCCMTLITETSRHKLPKDVSFVLHGVPVLVDCRADLSRGERGGGGGFGPLRLGLNGCCLMREREMCLAAVGSSGLTLTATWSLLYFPK